jgi:threonine synthase
VELRELDGSFDDALEAARELADSGTHALVNSLNPHRLQGQKTVVFELLEELGRLPDAVALPYGGGGNTRAVALGFDEAGAGMPPLYAGQAVDRRTTFASAIRIATPAHGEHAEAAIRRSEGAVVSLDDDEIEAAWRSLAQEEGLFCEPASAASVAALGHADLPAGALVVCIVTGHGLKDPDAAGRLARR